jgi:hypothetical protein
MTQQASKPKVGYLRSCMDRRFLAATRRTFEKETGLGETEYFHEAFAGGALGTPPEVNGADYVYNRAFNDPKDIDLVVMGWQVHLDHCGGLPGKHDEEILAAFKQLRDANTLQNKYPNVKHIFLVQPTLTLNFANTGAYLAWCNLDYVDPSGQFCHWESGFFGPQARSIEIPAGATKIRLASGATGFNSEPGGPILNGSISNDSLLTEGTKNFYFAGSLLAPTNTYSGMPLL